MSIYNSIIMDYTWENIQRKKKRKERQTLMATKKKTKGNTRTIKDEKQIAANIIIDCSGKNFLQTSQTCINIQKKKKNFWTETKRNKVNQK